MPDDPVITKLRKRLARWELEHLREHARMLSDVVDELREQLADTRALLADAEDRAATWAALAQEMREGLSDELSIGMAKDGTLGLVDAEPAGRPLTKRAAAKPVIKTAAGKGTAA